jgi:hypothetical protein
LIEEETMRNAFKRFLWTSKFWALIGVFGCVSGLIFQRIGGNGLEVWCLGLCFFGAAYVERQEEPKQRRK